MDHKSSLIQDILALQQDIRQARSKERQIQRIEQGGNVLFSQPAARQNALQAHLNSILPPELIPSNVGDINEVQWGFFYQVDFDFGIDPVWNANVNARKSFKVTNESAFLVTRIYRDTDDAGIAGLEAPLSLVIRDLQSSRQFMDKGVPLQAIPSKGYFYELPIPFLLYPAASADLELKCWLPNGVNIPSTGVGTQRFTLYGARVRVQNPTAIIKTMFKNYGVEE
jgi:hypothetical protein